MNHLKLVTLALFVATTMARADQGKINFSGVITSASGSLPFDNGPVSVGDPFTGFMAWDTRWDGSPILDDSAAYPDDFIYPYVALKIGSYGGSIIPVTGGGQGEFSIYNTAVYDAITFDGELTTQNSIFGFVTLISSNGKGITTGAPSSNPADWNSGYIGIADERSGDFGITGTIPDSASTGALLTLGIAGLFFCRSRVTRSGE